MVLILLGLLLVQQTFGSAGAGEEMEGAGSTNLRLRWSREGMEDGGCYNIRPRWRGEGMDGVQMVSRLAEVHFDR